MTDKSEIVLLSIISAIINLFSGEFLECIIFFSHWCTGLTIERLLHTVDKSFHKSSEKLDLLTNE